MGRLRSAFQLHVIATAGLGISFVCSILLSKYFGTTRIVDAYGMAELLVFLLILYSESLKEASIAQLKMVDFDNRAEANRAISAVISLFALISIALIGATWLFIDPIVSLLTHKQAPELFGDVRRIAIYLVPLVLLQSLTTLLEGYLYVQKRYLVSQISKLFGLAAGLGVLVFGYGTLEWGILAYVAYRLVAFGIQLTGCILALPKAGFRYTPTLRLRHGREILTKFAPLFAAELSIIGVIFLVKWALQSDAGALASYGYAERIWGATLMLLVGPVSSVIWPDLIAARRDGEQAFWTGLHTPMRLLLAVLAGTALLLVCLAEPTIMVVLERGKFDQTSRTLTAECLRLLALSLPFHGLALICKRAMVVQGRTRTLLGITIGVNCLAAGAIVLVISRSGAQTFDPIYALVAGFAVISLLSIRAVFSGSDRFHHRTYQGYVARILIAAAIVTGLFYLFDLDQRLVQAIHQHGKTVGLAILAVGSAVLLSVYTGALMLLGESDGVRYALEKFRNRQANQTKPTGR